MAQFGNPVLGKMLKDMTKAQQESTRASARGARGRQASAADVGQATGMDAQFVQTVNEWADRLFAQARAAQWAEVLSVNDPVARGPFWRQRDPGTPARMGPWGR